MIRVISSPSSSTTGFFTSILGMSRSSGSRGRAVDAIARVLAGRSAVPAALRAMRDENPRAPAGEGNRGHTAGRGRLLEGVFVDQHGATVAGDTRALDGSAVNAHFASGPGGGAHRVYRLGENTPELT